MKKSEKNVMQTVFANNDIALYSELTERINSCQRNAEGIAKTIAGALYMVKQKELYKIDSFKNIYEYADMRHGISRGTTSDAINVFKRFCNPDNKTQLLPEWDAYAWRALIMIKNLDDDTIKRLEILPTTSSETIRQRVKDYKLCADRLPADWTLESLNNMLLLEDKENEEPKDAAADNAEPADTTETIQGEKEESAEAIEHKRQQAMNIMGEDAYNDLVESEGENIDAAIEDYLDEFNSFPKRVVNIADLDDKAAIAEIKKLLAGIRANEYEVIITA